MKGMLSSRGQQLLFADADGATKFSDIVKLQDKLKQLLKGITCHRSLMKMLILQISASLQQNKNVN